MASKIVVGQSDIHGKGIFAKRDIKKGEIVFIIKGKLVHWVVKDMKTSLCSPMWVGVDKNLWIDPTGPANFLNHSCNPNCGIKGKVEVIAIKNIKKGEEITIDYSTTEADLRWFMKCDCENKNCRKIIKSIQFLPIKQFKKYLPFVPTYFKNLYLKNNKKLTI